MKVMHKIVKDVDKDAIAGDRIKGRGSLHRSLKFSKQNKFLVSTCLKFLSQVN